MPEAATATLSIAELRAALDALSEPDLVRLRKIARIYAGGTNLEPDDLLQEAVLRALNGNRTCPKGVALLTFLANAMRSIAWAARERTKSDPVAQASEDVTDEASTASQVGTPGRSPEEDIIAREEQKRGQDALLDLFGDDEQALQMLMGDLDDLPAEEVRTMWNMDKKTYASTRRRIRRKIERKLHDGWEL